MEATPIAKLMDLSGKIAIVTGGAMGIGLGIVRRLHEAGANVLIADLDEAAAQTAAATLNSKRPDSAIALRCDVSQSADAQTVVRTAVEKFGGLDIMVNNAGIFPFMPLAQMDEAGFMKVIDTNLRSVYLFTKYASDQMIVQNRGGKIINVASVDSLHPSAVGLAAYDASKHGVWGFTKNVALELAKHQIAVNAIAPGGVATPGVAKATGGNLEQAKQQAANVPMGRMGDPDDMGRVALFLASELSSYMTGSLVVADGGMLLQ